MKEERIDFEVSRNVIGHLINKQAGTLDKAILEGVMNSIDAKATRVDIRFEGLDRVVIEDDGCGFRSRDEINRHFVVFAFDHDAEKEKVLNRTYGSFGLGRGQIMAFAAATWETHQFAMSVDSRNQGNGFVLREDPRRDIDGCVITARLYEPLEPSGVESVKRDLCRAVRHAPVPVSIDGECVVERDVEWDVSTEQLHFQRRPNAQAGVDLYNLGVYVRTYPHYSCGVSGVLVSHSGPGFALNTARNDVLQAHCPLWREAGRIFSAEAELRRASIKPRDEDCAAIAHELVDLPCSDRARYADKRILKTVLGQFVSPKQVRAWAGGRFVVAPTRGSVEGEAIHKDKLAMVLAPEVIDWYTKTGPTALADHFNFLWHKSGDEPAFTALDYHKLAPQYKLDARLLPPEKWTAVERAGVKALRQMGQAVFRHANLATYGCGDFGDLRHITLGESTGLNGWTDGISFIAIERTFLRKQLTAGVAGFAALVGLLLHEYIHDNDSIGSHIHGHEFYRTFHDVMRSPLFDSFGIATNGFKAYCVKRRESSIPDTKKLSRGLRRIQQTDDLEQDRYWGGNEAAA